MNRKNSCSSSQELWQKEFLQVSYILLLDYHFAHSSSNCLLRVCYVPGGPLPSVTAVNRTAA